MTAGYRVILFNFKAGQSVPVSKIRDVLDRCKDWLKFHPEAWLVYTALPLSELRDRLTAAFKSEDPSILVLEIDIAKWSAYSTAVSREWVKRQRNSDLVGE